MNTTILLVDDNPANLAMLFDHLRTNGFRVLIADSGILALEQASLTHPDLILLDIRMPGMDGYETCRALKANTELAAIPVIFVSALNDVDNRLKGFEAGGVDYVSKPFDVLEVTARINAHIMLTTLRRQLLAANKQLKEAVTNRTEELRVAQGSLQTEVGRRKDQETRIVQLVTMLQAQNEQLQLLLTGLLQSNPAIWLDLAHFFEQHVMTSLTTMEAELRAALQEMDEDAAGFGRIENALHFKKLAQAALATLSTQPFPLPASAEDNTQTAEPTTLSAREREVLTLLADGLTSIEIGARLTVSDATIRTYRARIMRKLDIHHLPGLVKYALRHNLTTLD